MVHNVYAFVAVILPRYFKQSKYKSFQRQLNVWCFERVNRGPEKGAYRHPSFIRGQHVLCREMQRKKVKGSSSSQPSPVQLPIVISSSSSASRLVSDSSDGSVSDLKNLDDMGLSDALSQFISLNDALSQFDSSITDVDKDWLNDHPVPLVVINERDSIMDCDRFFTEEILGTDDVPTF